MMALMRRRVICSCLAVVLCGVGHITIVVRAQATAYPGPAPLDCRDDVDGARIGSFRELAFSYGGTADLQVAIDDFCAAHLLDDADCAMSRPVIRRRVFRALGLDTAYAAATAAVTCGRADDELTADEQLDALVVGLRALNARDEAASASSVEVSLSVDDRITVPLDVDGTTAEYYVGGDDDPRTVARAACDASGLDGDRCAQLTALIVAELPTMVCGALRKSARRRREAANATRHLLLRAGLGEATPSTTTFVEAWAAAKRRFPTNNQTTCASVFVDLGSYSGDSLRRFALREEADDDDDDDDASSSSSSSGLSRWARDHVGTTAASRREFCLVGFEGNPAFTPTLKALEGALLAAGFRARIFTETVVSAVEGAQRFFIDTHSQGAWGSSLRMEHPDVIQAPPGAAVEHVVASRRLARVLTHLVDDGATRLLVKMDIEGAEYVILEDLLNTGLGCALARRAHVTLLLELHPYMEVFFLPNSHQGIGDAMVFLLRRCGLDIVLSTSAHKGETD